MTEEERRTAVTLGQCTLAIILTEICDADAAGGPVVKKRELVAAEHFRTAWLRVQNEIARANALRNARQALVQS